MKNNLSKESAGVQHYASPVCEVFLLRTQRVICASETEKVTEQEGEW